MNRTILVAGGTCVVSLAAGAVGGYLYAKEKLGKEFDLRMDIELASIRKRHAIQLQEARTKPSLDDIEVSTGGREKSSAARLGEHLGVNVDGLATSVEEETEEHPTPEEIERRDNLRQNGTKARTDYAGISTQNITDATVESNIFSKKPTLPPRDEGGKFIPKARIQEPSDGTAPPYIIDEQMFLANVQEHHQRSLLWFIRDSFLSEKLDGECDEFDMDKVGAEENLSKFDEKIPKDEPNYIYVRNDGLEEDYQIRLVFGTLEEYMGENENADALEEGDLHYHN